MKTFYSFLAAVLFYINTFSQIAIAPKDTMIKRSKATAEKIIKESPYIFEGTVIKSESFIGKDKDFYTSNIIQINKILRGKDLKLGTIEIITHGGDATFEDPRYPGTYRVWMPCQDCRELYLGQGQSKMFFCIPSDTNLTVLNINTDNTIRLKTKKWYFGYAIGLPKTDGGIAWMNLSFKNREELYGFLSKHDDITIPKETIEKKSEDVKPEKIKNDTTGNYQKYQQNVENYNKYMKQRQAIIDKSKQKGQ